jgi:hypothetical protein
LHDEHVTPSFTWGHEEVSHETSGGGGDGDGGGGTGAMPGGNGGSDGAHASIDGPLPPKDSDFIAAKYPAPSKHWRRQPPAFVDPEYAANSSSSYP